MIKAIQLPKLPELKGTKKQVEWAEKIRKEAIKSAEYEVMHEEYVSKSRMPMGKDKIVKRSVATVVRTLLKQETINEYLKEGGDKEILEKTKERFERWKELIEKDSAKFWIENRSNTEHNHQYNAFCDYVAYGTKKFKEIE